MDISVILWDAGFRERYHTIDCLMEQSLPEEEYEVVWVEYFDEINREVTERESEYKNFRTHFIGGKKPWHAGRCVNEGIRQTSNDLVIVLDGDVVVHPEFLSNVLAAHEQKDDLSMHVERWDELERHRGHVSWEPLKEVCERNNPSNYGGCISVRRNWLEQIGGCDEHPRFQRASAVFKDLHVRLQNLGLDHRWSDTDVLLHPWHPGTGAVAEHIRSKHQMGVIEARKRNGKTSPDYSSLSEPPYRQSAYDIHAKLYYLYAKGEAHLYDKAVVRPYLAAKRLYQIVSDSENGTVGN